jgi:hypothetical protein
MMRPRYRRRGEADGHGIRAVLNYLKCTTWIIRPRRIGPDFKLTRLCLFLGRGLKSEHFHMKFAISS